MKGKNEVKINPNMGEQNELAAKATKPTEDSREKRIKMVKRGILQKKLQAVRAGAGADITASHKPEGKVISEKETVKKEINPTVQSALDALNVIEGKKKGLDGKECWDGYKLAGTKKKGGKTVDNCVKVKEDSEYGYDKEGKSLNPDDKPVKDQTNKQVASVTFDGGGTDGGLSLIHI